MKNQSLYILFAAVCGVLLLPSCSKDQPESAQQDAESVVIIEQEAEQIVPAATAGKSITLSENDNAADILRNAIGNGNVVIDFYASWCGPCKIMSPIIDALAAERPDITFIKIDIDKHPAVSSGFTLAGKKLDVSSIPTFYFFKGGKYADELHGGMKKESFVKKLNAVFSGK